MNLERTYHRLALSLAVLGVLSYCTADENLGLALIAIPALVIGWYLTRGPSGLRLPRLLVNLLLVGAIGYIALRAVDRRIDVTDVSQLVVFILLLKLGDRRAPRDEAQILALAVFLGIAAMLTSNTLAVGTQILLMLPLLIATVMVFQLYSGQQSVEHQRRGVPAPLIAGRRVARHLRAMVTLGGLGAAASALAVFLLMPRGVGENYFGYWGPAARGSTTGFTDWIRLGTRGLISESPTVVMDVAVTDRAGENLAGTEVIYYLRGAVLDQYDERGWTSRPENADRGFQLDAGGTHRMGALEAGAIRQTVNMHAAAAGAARLFAMWRPVQVTVKQRSSLNVDGRDLTIRVHRQDAAPFAYTVESSLAEPGLGEGKRSAASFPRPAIREFAEGLLREQGIEPDPSLRPVDDDLRICNLFQQFLRSQFAYTLELDAVPEGEDPIERFLFVTKRGHCEYFASTMAAMCRSVGVPARVISGYVAAEYNETSQTYTVRESNAHAWVEAEVGEGRWRRYDPTPPADLVRLHRPSLGILGRARQLLDAVEYLWNSSVVSFDETARKRLLDSGAGGGGLLSRLDRVSERLRTGGPGLLARSLIVGVTVFAIVGGVGVAIAAIARRTPWGAARRRRRRATADPEVARRLAQAQFYERLLDALARRGHAKPLWRPPLDHARTIAGTDAPLAAGAEKVVGLFYKLRFGPGLLDDDERRAAERLVRELNAAPRG